MARVDDGSAADAGRRRELERLYREQGDRLWRSLLAYAGDSEVASDAVAEAFAQALRGGHRIRDPERWVWRAAFKIAGGELGRRRREWALELPDASYEIEGSAVELVKALARLPRSQRIAVVLHHAAGYPVKDIAGLIGSTPAAVKVHLLRARRRLRDLLEDSRA